MKCLPVGAAFDGDARLRHTIHTLREWRARLEHQASIEQQRRRAEDRIREELHDARATIIRGTQQTLAEDDRDGDVHTN